MSVSALTLYNLFCFIYLLVAVLGLRCHMDFSLVVVWGLPTVVRLPWSAGSGQVCFSNSARGLRALAPGL